MSSVSGVSDLSGLVKLSSASKNLPSNGQVASDVQVKQVSDVREKLRDGERFAARA